MCIRSICNTQWERARGTPFYIHTFATVSASELVDRESSQKRRRDRSRVLYGPCCAYISLADKTMTTPDGAYAYVRVRVPALCFIIILSLGAWLAAYTLHIRRGFLASCNPGTWTDADGRTDGRMHIFVVLSPRSATLHLFERTNGPFLYGWLALLPRSNTCEMSERGKGTADGRCEIYCAGQMDALFPVVADLIVSLCCTLDIAGSALSDVTRFFATWNAKLYLFV